MTVCEVADRADPDAEEQNHEANLGNIPLNHLAYLASACGINPTRTFNQIEGLQEAIKRMRREERKGCPVTWRSGTQPRQPWKGGASHHLIRANSHMELVAFHGTFPTTVTPWKGITSRYPLFIPRPKIAVAEGKESCDPKWATTPQ